MFMTVVLQTSWMLENHIGEMKRLRRARASREVSDATPINVILKFEEAEIST
jgi:hypothetical protein